MGNEYIMERRSRAKLRIKIKQYTTSPSKEIYVQREGGTESLLFTAEEALEFATVLMYFAKEINNENDSDKGHSRKR